ncbi:amino acid ABC transporter substrate-binding protein [Ensifer sp. Root423]|uniref:amino acid ABC transporter substrate-binding protein n=1 Tax=Ensifer sp. Root423 TaxID=1736534 RepID=UPI0007163246|nr:amino acid ABC transporter substrate-binding protein [Ensifer sp. Root423]KQX02954.1 amino acid ABC transporter substrate-binding protein [Ensifer sp. Root423]
MNKLSIIPLALTVMLTPAVSQGRDLETIKKKGELVCASHPGLAGFGYPDEDGNWKGFDVDYCRAIAAAVFGSGDKVKFVPVSAKDRFTVLQSGEVDVLVRNTTWTMSRDTELGLDFTAINYYDGQGFMVRKDLNIQTASQLDGASICVVQGSTSELNLADYFRTRGLKYEALTFADADAAVKAYESGRCDAFTDDATTTYGYMQKLSKPDDHVILPEVISKEPLSVTVLQGDPRWADVTRWVHFALVNAEELGVSQHNVDEMMKSENPEVRRLLGIEGTFGQSLGLSATWAADVIRATGNYGEIFARNLGEDSPMKVKRGLNELWSKGGLQYGVPVR